MRWVYLPLLLGVNLYGQSILQGRVIDAKRGLSIANVTIRDSLGIAFKTKTDAEGLFTIREMLIHQKSGEQDRLHGSIKAPFVSNQRGRTLTIIAEHEHYQTQFIPLVIQDTITQLTIALQWKINDQYSVENSVLASEYDDEINQVSLSGPLNAYGDPVTQAEQFDFRALFYNQMGASRYQRGLVFQGMRLTDPISGRIMWNMLTGLNLAMRFRKNQGEFTPDNEGFGQLGGTTYIGIRPDEFNPGTRIKTQFGNRSYQWGYGIQRVFPKKNGWSGLVLVTARDGMSGWTKGNAYHALGGLFSIEKELNSGMSIGLLAAYTPVKRGMSTPLTREVLRLKGNRYNPNWGWQNNTWRNSRERFSRMPMVMVSLYGPRDIKNQWTLQLGVTSGVFGQSRLNYSTGMNPFGHHYTRMPSYFLGEVPQSSYDYYRAYIAQGQFLSDGQINWPDLYRANTNGVFGQSKYLIQNETSQRSDFHGRWMMTRPFNKRQSLSLTLAGRWIKERRFAEISDLLGGAFYLDRNNFYQGIDPLGQWNNLDTVNQALYLGDKIDYDYHLGGVMLEGFGQYTHALRQGQLVMGLQYSRVRSERYGHMRHGIFSHTGDSYGPSSVQWHQAFKTKLHWAHYWSPKFSSAITAVYDQQLPTLEQTFVYSRYHNKRIDLQRLPELYGLFGQFRYQSSDFDLVCKPFAHLQRFTRQNGYFYSDHIRAASGGRGLVQRHLWNLDQLSFGLRSGIKFMVGERLTFSAVHVLSTHKYTGVAKLMLSGTNLITHGAETSASNLDANTYEYSISDFERLGSRKVFLKGYRPAVGPQKIAHLSLTYRDPSFWWMGLVLSHFSDRYVGPSALRRSEDAFFQNAYALAPQFDDYDLSTLWHQEQLPAVTLTSLKMGVSWRIHEMYISVFGSIQNLFNQTFVSGGFESSRKVLLMDLAQDQQRPFGPIFGNKYFPGIGRSYYLTCSISF